MPKLLALYTNIRDLKASDVFSDNVKQQDLLPGISLMPPHRDSASRIRDGYNSFIKKSKLADVSTSADNSKVKHHKKEEDEQDITIDYLYDSSEQHLQLYGTQQLSRNDFNLPKNVNIVDLIKYFLRDNQDELCKSDCEIFKALVYNHDYTHYLELELSAIKNIALRAFDKRKFASLKQVIEYIVYSIDIPSLYTNDKEQLRLIIIDYFLHNIHVHTNAFDLYHHFKLTLNVNSTFIIKHKANTQEEYINGMLVKNILKNAITIFLENCFQEVLDLSVSNCDGKELYDFDDIQSYVILGALMCDDKKTVSTGKKKVTVNEQQEMIAPRILKYRDVVSDLIKEDPGYNIELSPYFHVKDVSEDREHREDREHDHVESNREDREHDHVEGSREDREHDHVESSSSIYSDDDHEVGNSY